MHNCRKDGHRWVTKCVNCHIDRPNDPFVRMPRAEWDAILAWLDKRGLREEFEGIRDDALLLRLAE